MCNPTHDHHYIPIFYLRRWLNVQGRLCELSKPYGDIVKPRRTTPKATGCADKLYSLDFGSGEREDLFETGFLQRIDNDVSDIFHDLAERHFATPTQIRFNAEDASCLSRFFLSLMFRDPESINGFKSAITSFVTEIAFALKTEAERRGYDQERLLSSYAAFLGSKLGAQQLQMYSGMIDNPLRGNMLNRLMWFVVELTSSAPRLFTSDRPVVLSDVGFDDPKSFVALPMSPAKALIAFRDRHLAASVLNLPSEVFAAKLNTFIVEQTTRLVYDTDDCRIEFVQTHMGKRGSPTYPQSLVTVLADKIVGSIDNWIARYFEIARRIDP